MPCHSSSTTGFVLNGFRTQDRPSSRNRKCGMSRNQRRDVEFALRVKATMALGHLLAQQTVGSYQFAVAKRDRVRRHGRRRLNDNQVITDRIKAVTVDAEPGVLVFCAGAAFFIEDAVAEALAGFYLVSAHRLTQDQRAAGGANVWCVWQYAALLGAVFATDTRILKVL